MNQAACTLLLSLLVAAPWGCEAKNTRGSGQIVTTPDGVIIDKYVIDPVTGRTYDLQAIVLHMRRRAHAGHYTCACASRRQAGRWELLDDAVC